MLAQLPRLFLVWISHARQISPFCISEAGTKHRYSHNITLRLRSVQTPRIKWLIGWTWLRGKDGRWRWGKSLPFGSMERIQRPLAQLSLMQSLTARQTLSIYPNLTMPHSSPISSERMLLTVQKRLGAPFTAIARTLRIQNSSTYLWGWLTGTFST